MRQFLYYYGIFAMYHVLVVNCIYFIITLISFKSIFMIVKGTIYNRYEKLSGSDYVPPVSLLVPSYNEELTIIESVRSLLGLNYPNYEVIVVNDGSSDNTLRELIHTFGLKQVHHIAVRNRIPTNNIRGIYYNPNFPNLYVIDKENGGKADTLNAGINFSHFPLIASIDADSLLEKDALIRMAKVYLENPEETIAIGGNVRIVNDCDVEYGIVKNVRLPRKMLPAFQTIEYIKAFIGGRIGWSTINGLSIVSGAFGVFRKELVITVGGYREGYPGEDMNIILKLHKYMKKNKFPYKIAFCPDAVCWTQSPDTFRILGSQRKRWARGTLKNMSQFYGLLFNPRYKTLGLVTMPYILFYEILSPYVKITGLLSLIAYKYMAMTTWSIVFTFILINISFDYFLTVLSFLIEEISFGRYNLLDISKMLLYALYMAIWYYHLGDFWRLLGHIQYFRNNNTWGVMTRQRF